MSLVVSIITIVVYISLCAFFIIWLIHSSRERAKEQRVYYTMVTDELKRISNKLNEHK